MILAHLSDLHIRRDNARPAFGRLDTTAMTRAAFFKLDQLSVKPDVLIVTGDLSDTGHVEEYRILRQLVDQVTYPVHLILGNHDIRANFLEIFPEYKDQIPGSNFVQYDVAYPNIRIIALDTLVEEEGHGALCDIRLNWLRQKLSTDKDKATLLLTHHAPFKIGSTFYDAVRLIAGAEELREIVRANPQVTRILCGHHHRSIDCVWGGTLASAAPAVVNALDLELGDLQVPRAIEEPPAFKLHVWVPDEGLVSHTVYVKEYGGPFEALPDPDYPALTSFQRDTGLSP